MVCHACSMRRCLLFDMHARLVPRQEARRHTHTAPGAQVPQPGSESWPRHSVQTSGRILCCTRCRPGSPAARQAPPGAHTPLVLAHPGHTQHQWHPPSSHRHRTASWLPSTLELSASSTQDPGSPAPEQLQHVPWEIPRLLQLAGLQHHLAASLVPRPCQQGRKQVTPQPCTMPWQRLAGSWRAAWQHRPSSPPQLRIQPVQRCVQLTMSSQPRILLQLCPSKLQLNQSPSEGAKRQQPLKQGLHHHWAQTICGPSSPAASRSQQHYSSLQPPSSRLH